MQDAPGLAGWIQANTQWLGYAVMAFLGGAIAHLLAFEKADVTWPYRRHAERLLSCWAKAAFIALIIFYLREEYKWSDPLCFVGTGVLSVFANDAITTFYYFIKKRLGLGDMTGRGGEEPKS